MNTKKLNAGIAMIALQNMHQQGELSDNQLKKCVSLSERLVETALYKHDGADQDQAGIEQAFNLIEDYLRAVSTDINIGDRVEVLEDNPDDSEENYSKGEVGIVTRMRDSTCDVNFGFGDWNTAEIPFTSLKKVAN